MELLHLKYRVDLKSRAPPDYLFTECFRGIFWQGLAPLPEKVRNKSTNH